MDKQTKSQEKDKPKEEIFPPLNFQQLLALPSKQWLIHQMIGVDDLCMIYGQPACGKSFVAIDLILAACLGQTFAERFVVAKPLNIAYCAGEGVSGLPGRFAAAAEHYGVTNLQNFTFFSSVPDLTGKPLDMGGYILDYTIEQFAKEWEERENKQRIKDEINDVNHHVNQLDLLIIDTLHSATPGAEENSASDMGRLISACRSATRRLGCAVVLIHHTNKDGSAERGSSSLRGAMDCMIEIKQIRKDETKAVMSCSKLKDGEAWKSQTFDLVAQGDNGSVRVWWDKVIESNRPDGGKKGKEELDRERILEYMADHPGCGITVKDVQGLVKTKDTTQAQNLLIDLVDSGKCKRYKEQENKKVSAQNPYLYTLL